MAEVIEIDINAKDNTSNATKSAGLNFQRLGRDISNVGMGMSRIFTRPIMDLTQMILKNKEVQASLQPLKDEWAKISNELAVSFIPVIKELTPALLSLAKTLGEVVRWFSGLTVAQKETIISIVGLAAAIGPLLVGIGQVITVIGSLKVAWDALKISSMISSLGNLAVSAWATVAPFLAVTAAILALGYAAYKVIQFTDMLLNGILKLYKLGVFSGGANTKLALGAVFGGKRANGGPVSAGTPYMVGERGPELFIPSSNGSIRPNGGGGAIVINYSPMISLADRNEVLTKFAPIIREAMRGA